MRNRKPGPSPGPILLLSIGEKIEFGEQNWLFYLEIKQTLNLVSWSKTRNKTIFKINENISDKMNGNCQIFPIQFYKKNFIFIHHRYFSCFLAQISIRFDI